METFSPTTIAIAELAPATRLTFTLDVDVGLSLPREGEICAAAVMMPTTPAAMDRGFEMAQRTGVVTAQFS